MAEVIVACFPTQFQANAAAEKLISRGVAREQIVLTFNESIGHSPASSTAPTSVVSKVSHRGDVEASADKKKPRLISDRSPTHIADPSVIGHTTVVVKLRSEMRIDEVFALLEDAGASSMVQADEDGRVPEDPAMWPALGRASREEIERSIRASRRGAALKTGRDR